MVEVIRIEGAREDDKSDHAAVDKLWKSVS